MTVTVTAKAKAKATVDGDVLHPAGVMASPESYQNEVFSAAASGVNGSPATYLDTPHAMQYIAHHGHTLVCKRRHGCPASTKLPAEKNLCGQYEEHDAQPGEDGRSNLRTDGRSRSKKNHQGRVVAHT